MNFLAEETNYHRIQEICNKAYECGYCGCQVSSDRGYKIGVKVDGSGKQLGGVYICPNCHGPTFFSPYGTVFPSPSFGNIVTNLPNGVDSVYEEARRCTSQNCFTAAVLLCRKLLMNISVDQGAKEGLKFIEYVDYLSDKGYIPPNGKHWVDHIRMKGNEATHEIIVMKADDAKDIIIFTEMLLKFIYEFPSMVKPSSDESQTDA